MSGAVVASALTMHEFATNASKYGALSIPTGRVDLTWSVERGEKESTSALTWTEHGGPAVTAPAQRGFGSQLIERGFGAGAEVALDFAPGGVVANLRTPRSAFQSGIASR